MGAGAGSFAAGFGKGLTASLLRNQNIRREERHRTEERQAREAAMLLPIHLQLAGESGDYSGVEEYIAQNFPEIGKTLKKQGGLTSVAPFLVKSQPSGQPQQAPDPAAAQQESVLSQFTGVQSPQAPLPSTNPVAPGIPPKRGSTFFGTPVTTPEQRAERDFNSQMSLARKAYAQLKEQFPDSDVTLEDVLRSPRFQILPNTRTSLVGQTYGEGEIVADPSSPTGYSQTLYLRSDPTQQKRIPASPPGARPGAATEPYQSVPGTVNGKPAFGVFDQTKGVYLDPNTKQPLQGFSPQVSGSSSAATQDNADLASMAADNPSVLQGLTPTALSGVLNAIAKNPDLRARYEAQRMVPVRESAQRAAEAIKDLVIVDPKTNKVTGLKPGTMAIYGPDPFERAQSFIPGSPGATAKATLAQVTGQLTLDLINQMKAQTRTGATGFGALNVKELGVLESAATVLKGEISEAKALEELTKLYERFSQILQPGSDGTAGKGGGAPADAGAQGSGESRYYKGDDGKWRVRGQ